MAHSMDTDKQQFAALMQQFIGLEQDYFETINEKPVANTAQLSANEGLTELGTGASEALEYFSEFFAEELSGSNGPRYLGFVTGGATPAAIIGDWLTSLYDQNAANFSYSLAGQIELLTIEMLKDLFSLKQAYTGSFVSGATMANFVGLAQGRQQIGKQYGQDLAESGLFSIPEIKIASGTPHSSISKAAAMLGIGRNALQPIPVKDDREAVDLAALETFLKQLDRPCIVVANAGTVNTVDFDDLEAIGQLKKNYPFWLHVDAAFGGFAACSPKFEQLLTGLNHADSITIDAHKWLNVPYDSAMQFTQHQELQLEVFNNHASYLNTGGAQPDFSNLTPENSRRFRALPAWFTLKAYGKAGYRQLVEQNSAFALELGKRITDSPFFELLSPVRLNGVCFALKDPTKTTEFLKKSIKRVRSF